MGTQTLGDRHHQPKRITTVTQIHGDQARTNPNSVLTLIDLKAAARQLFIVQNLWSLLIQLPAQVSRRPVVESHSLLF